MGCSNGFYKTTEELLSHILACHADVMPQLESMFGLTLGWFKSLLDATASGKSPVWCNGQLELERLLCHMAGGEPIRPRASPPLPSRERRKEKEVRNIKYTCLREEHNYPLDCMHVAKGTPDFCFTAPGSVCYLVCANLSQNPNAPASCLMFDRFDAFRSVQFGKVVRAKAGACLQASIDEHGSLAKVVPPVDRVTECETGSTNYWLRGAGFNLMDSCGGVDKPEVVLESMFHSLLEAIELVTLHAKTTGNLLRGLKLSNFYFDREVPSKLWFIPEGEFIYDNRANLKWFLRLDAFECFQGAVKQDFGQEEVGQFNYAHVFNQVAMWQACGSEWPPVDLEGLAIQSRDGVTTRLTSPLEFFQTLALQAGRAEACDCAFMVWFCAHFNQLNRLKYPGGVRQLRKDLAEKHVLFEPLEKYAHFTAQEMEELRRESARRITEQLGSSALLHQRDHLIEELRQNGLLGDEIDWVLEILANSFLVLLVRSRLLLCPPGPGDTLFTLVKRPASLGPKCRGVLNTDWYSQRVVPCVKRLLAVAHPQKSLEELETDYKVLSTYWNRDYEIALRPKKEANEQFWGAMKRLLETGFDSDKGSFEQIEKDFRNPGPQNLRREGCVFKLVFLLNGWERLYVLDHDFDLTLPNRSLRNEIGECLSWFR